MIERPVDFADAINSLCPGSQWKMEDNDLENIEWFDEEITRPSVKEIIAERDRLESERSLEANKQESIKNNAIAKLQKLGLTIEEAKAIVGV